MIRVAIVDDQKHYIEKVKELFEQCMPDKNYEISEYTDCKSFLSDMERNFFDIVFLDIVFEKENGIDLGIIINEKYPDTNIIFISMYEEYFKDVYKVRHSYFLTKELEKERFDDAVKKTLKNIQRSYIWIHDKNEIHQIKLNELAYIESSLKHTKFFMADGSCREFNVNIKKVETMLSDSFFVRVHQSFIVNLECIARFNRQSVFLIDGMEIPISRARAAETREKITFFMGGVL